MEWYSALGVYVVRIGQGATADTMRSVFLVLAHGFDEAFSKVIDRAKMEEKRYVNSNGEVVEWMLSRIETLDWIGETIEDGREVYSEPGAPVSVPVGDVRYHPEDQVPTQTGV